MGILYYRTAQNTTGTTYCWSSKVTNSAIGICDANGKITYVGCKSSNVDHYDVTIGSVIYRYYYSSSKPTIQAITASGERIYGFNTYTTIYKSHIPAGTYSPADFENMIRQYISNNGSRIVANSFTVKVNNQSVSVSAGNLIYYKVESSSPRGYARYVSFSSRYEIGLDACNSTHGFSDYKFYVTHIATGSGFEFVNAFKTYANYPITVITGINFR